ncbi:MAG TPA: helix-turn-helix transcriptional regulator [Pirellulales bacterium]|nr:helix-turn-helix transcriptional regulator [Pirellulales bacterium]
MKIERSLEDQARIDAVRERFQRDRPSLEELLASGEFEPPVPQGEHWDLVEMLVALRSARERAGQSREEIASRMGVDSEDIVRLETGKKAPTLEILNRYAAALGKQIVLSLADLPDPSSSVYVPRQ